MSKEAVVAEGQTVVQPELKDSFLAFEVCVDMTLTFSNEWALCKCNPGCMYILILHANYLFFLKAKSAATHLRTLPCQALQPWDAA